MDKNQLVASNIKKIRMQKNILQKRVASHLDLSENAYSRIENGFIKITIDNLFLIAEALESTIEDILELNPPKTIHNNGNEVLSQFNEGSFVVTMTPENFAHLMSQISKSPKGMLEQQNS